MKKFTYPAVVYYDEDNKVYVMHIEELGLVAEGATMEEAQSYMNIYLSHYLCTSLSFGFSVPEPEKYNTVQSKNPKNRILLIDSVINDEKLKNYQ